MTVISVSRDKGEYRLCVEGHADYAEAGKDIVCASVSTVCNLCIAFLGEGCKVAVRDGFFEVVFPADNENVRFLSAVCLLFEGMARSFPENIRVNNFAFGEK